MTKQSRRLAVICDHWNHVNPVGTPMNYYASRRFGEKAVETYTTGPAFVVDDSVIKVHVDCMSEAVAIAQIKRRQVAA